MFTYPKALSRKELKRISKFPCGEEIKEAYKRYLTNYSFKEFAKYCEENTGDLEDLIFKFTDLQLEKFEPNSLIWVSHVMVNFLIYFNVNLDYGEYYDAYASLLQFTVLFCAMKIAVGKISFSEIEFPEHSRIGFERFFDVCLDFRFNLKTDCNLAYKSFNNDFDFTSEEFYLMVKGHFEKCGYYQ